jgi:uncharacterized 2Fe-2S/4Fe-4S cluster protein (DUF4445 family)
MQPIGRRVKSKSNTTLLEAAHTAGIEIVSLCGGIGACDSCIVRLIKGELSDLTLVEEAIFSQEELSSGYRLACQATPKSDIVVEIPPESLTTPQRLQLEYQGVEILIPDPIIEVKDIRIQEPTLQDLRADTTRLTDALLFSDISKPINFNRAILGELSNFMRDQNWDIRVALRDHEVIGVVPFQSQLYGLAVDIGTTKLAAYLMDLNNGKTIAKAGAMNPQISYGEDVINRISFANRQEDGRTILQSKVIQSINSLIGDLLTQASQSDIQITRDQIVDSVFVGNTVMHHLFAGLPVHQLGTAPYVPCVSEPLDIQAHEIGLEMSPGAYIHLPPNIAGYVGADHVAMQLSTKIFECKETTIAVDIGTNTEITLAHAGRLICCSCASGPAFEGAHISAGMRAGPGAIERIQFNGENLRIQTIGNQPPVGICGSGILDAVSELLSSNIINHRGAIESNHSNVKTNDKYNEYLIVSGNETGHGKDIYVTRQDVNEIQLAKGAIRAGIEILLIEAGISAKEVTSFIVAGAFGTYININSAIRVGMFPDIPMERFTQVGNAAGAGAQQILISKNQRNISKEIANRTEYIELSGHPKFMDVYTKSLIFAPT